MTTYRLSGGKGKKDKLQKLPDEMSDPQRSEMVEITCSVCKGTIAWDIGLFPARGLTEADPKTIKCLKCLNPFSSDVKTWKEQEEDRKDNGG